MTFKGFDPRTRLTRWGLVAVAVGIVLGGTLPAVMRDVGLVWDAHRASLPWLLERLAAFAAYLAMTGSVVYGLLLSTKLLDAIAHRPISFALHQDLAAIGLGLAGVHGALLGLDATVPFSLQQMVVPGLAPYAPIAVAFGQLTFYLTAIVVASFYARRRIGQRAWRALHVLTFLCFAGATAHGILAGSDSGAAWTWWMYALSVAAVVFLFAYRLVMSLARRGASARQQVLRGEPKQVATPGQVEGHLPAHDRPAELGRRVVAREQLGGGLG
jgi:sulfoxide reductase heme-binding subunit YedZ